VSNPLRDVFLAFARVHILFHASEERIFGVGMIRELARHGYELGPGTLYPMLHRMEDEGLLVAESATVDGKPRKYYTITRKGRSVLASIRPRLSELVREVLNAEAEHGRGPSSAARPKGNGKSLPGMRD
jgi:DNA-binding PadR family transcriptional regulator